jgi:hypothetical protein
MKKTFAAIVERSADWDQSKPPQEQPGFPDHAAYVAELEGEGYIAMAGLMLESTDVLFVFLADSEEQLRARIARDPWLQSGLTRLVRLEETQFRIGAPQQASGD